MLRLKVTRRRRRGARPPARRKINALTTARCAIHFEILQLQVWLNNQRRMNRKERKWRMRTTIKKNEFSQTKKREIWVEVCQEETNGNYVTGKANSTPEMRRNLNQKSQGHFPSDESRPVYLHKLIFCWLQVDDEDSLYCAHISRIYKEYSCCSQVDATRIGYPNADWLHSSKDWKIWFKGEFCSTSTLCPLAVA